MNELPPYYELERVVRHGRGTLALKVQDRLGRWRFMKVEAPRSGDPGRGAASVGLEFHTGSVVDWQLTTARILEAEAKTLRSMPSAALPRLIDAGVLEGPKGRAEVSDAALQQSVFEIFFRAGMKQIRLLVHVDDFTPPRGNEIVHGRGRLV